MRATTVVTVLGYGVTPKLAVFGVVPYVDKDLYRTVGGSRLSRGASGIGDVSLFGRFTLLQSLLPNRIEFTVSNDECQVYSPMMHKETRKRRSIALLVLLLVFGPLQAQMLFACEMMGVTLEACCCDDLTGATDRSADHAQREPCCETVVEVRADPDAAEAIQPVEVRSDVDPPTAIVAPSFNVSPSVVVHQPFRGDVDDHCASGQQTYLTTQRLRI